MHYEKPPSATTRTVFIVDDHAVVRRGLRQLFEREPDFQVCGEAEDVAQALTSIPNVVPDLVVSDLTLKGRNGLELTKQLQSLHPELPVLIISMHDEQLYADRALAAGARGYVMKCRSDNNIVEAARAVLDGRVYVNEGIWEHHRVDQPLDPLGATTSPMEDLTDRELEVFMLIGQGYAPRHIADKLSLSVSTIEVYRGRLKEKLGQNSSAELLRYAIRWCKDHALP
jgi:DNA-binding NarL/FixJ family response regulator